MSLIVRFVQSVNRHMYQSPDKSRHGLQTRTGTLEWFYMVIFWWNDMVLIIATNSWRTRTRDKHVTY